VNSLRNASTAADHIEVLVENSAGEDFQIAYPEITYGSNFRIWVRATLPALFGGGFNAQSVLESIEAAGAPTNAQSGISSDEVSDASINALGMGEVITSFRQVLKRFDKFPDVFNLDEYFQNSNIKVPADATVNDAVIAPMMTVWHSNATIGQNLASNHVSYFDCVASLYRFACGSMRILTSWRNAPPDSWYIYQASTNDVDEIEYWARATTAPSENEFRPYALQYSKFEPLQELHVPFYSPFPVNLGPMGHPENHILPTALKVSNGSGPKVYMSGVKGLSIDVRRATGEDFSFGYLVGPPVTAITVAS